MVTSETIAISVKGIDKEILTRKRKLWQLRNWYLNPGGTNQNHNIRGFYLIGLKAKEEIEKIKAIKESILRLKEMLK